LTTGFYFSYDRDISICKNKLAQGILHDDRMNWGLGLMESTLRQHIDRAWMMPLIQGFIGFFQCIFNGIRAKYYVISRRSRYMAGTRMNCRGKATSYDTWAETYGLGLDDEGHAANFVETEHILVLENKYSFTHVIVRGSLPLFWHQKGMLSSSIGMTRTLPNSNNAFMLHMTALQEFYGRVLLVNLLTDSEKEQKVLSDAYESLVKWNESILPFLKYDYCDFEAMKKDKTKYAAYLHKMQGINEHFKFMMEEYTVDPDTKLPTPTVHLLQKGIPSPKL
jgi:hypothetical protein